ncbi:hypothetical protein [Actinokineospora sp. NBRC 105648]|uniref:hypothetical protein n=1 Tax=Actinokineospora sp. NBRC 105648 TaxID=3032206 RepID=UPI0025554167|nr:hypothetical protein [Actinokineospora sp. NBRC 105648]
MFISSLRVPKSGSTPRECEDAVAAFPPADPETWLTDPVSVAISDGASESLLAGEWAALLTDSVVDAVRDDQYLLHDDRHVASALVDAAVQWRRWVGEYVARRVGNGRPIAWYERPKLDRGPHATVLAARFDHHPASLSTSWTAAALGDTCLFHTRGARLLHAFPLESAAAFGNSPGLVNGFSHDHALLAHHVQTASGTADQGDQFFLCTDALAAWFLAETERGGHPGETLCNFTRSGDLAGFETWLGDLRSAGAMGNDDVTVVHVDLG